MDEDHKINYSCSLNSNDIWFSSDKQENFVIISDEEYDCFIKISREYKKLQELLEVLNEEIAELKEDNKNLEKLLDV